MRWKRRRAKWPFFAGLGALLAFTLVAPLLWRRALLRGDRPAKVAMEPDHSLAPVTNQRVAEPSGAADPTTDGLATFEFDGFDRSVGQKPPALPPLAIPAQQLNEWGLADDLPSTVHLPAAWEESRGSVLAWNDYAADELETEQLAPAPRATSKPKVDIASILAIRDSIRSLMDQVQSWDWQKLRPSPPPARTPPRVRVEGPNDRLAMAPPRPSAPTPAVPTLAVPTTAAPTPATPTPATPTPATPTPAVRPEPRPAAPTLAGPRGGPIGSTPPPVNSEPSAIPATPRIAMRQADETPATPAPIEARRPQRPPVLRYEPIAMLDMLRDVESGTPFSFWAQTALEKIDVLIQEPSDDASEASGAIDALHALAIEASNYAAAAEDYEIQAVWLRLGQALTRRLPVWEQLVDPQARVAWQPTIDEANRLAIEAALQDIAELTDGKSEGPEWNEYLLVNELAALTSVGADSEEEKRREAARMFIQRTTSSDLTDAQRRFVALPSVVALRTLVERWASGKINLNALAGLIDRYEATGAARYGDVIHEQIQRMNYSGESDFQQLASLLERNYRGANMRVAFSDELFNRMLPQQGTVSAPVRQRIAGSDVRGRSQTSTLLHVRLLPDPNVLRLGLEATGDVRSHTYSETWPARVRNVGQMEYEARKLIVINGHGLHTWPADARASGSNQLVGVDSQLDPVPIIGSIVQGVARQQHRQKRSLALRQVRSRVANEARSRMDVEADGKLHQLEDRFEAAVMRPLESLALIAEPLDMHTTEQRAVMRLRMASDQQLAAYTPRPSAPADSLASVQLHESALNNAARGLQLEGRKMDAVELQQTLAEKLGRPLELAPEDVQHRASIKFADHDAVRVRCHGDRVELVLGIAELARGRDKIRNMEVHAFFHPIVEGLQVKLVREGTLQFDGYRLPPAQRVVLHTVFGKLLPKEDEIPLITPAVESDSRVADLMVTQLVIEDGWLALAVGPKIEQRVTWRTQGAAAR